MKTTILYIMSFLFYQTMFATSFIKQSYWYNISDNNAIQFADKIVEQKSYLEIICDIAMLDTIYIEAYKENKKIFQKQINNWSEEEATNISINENIHSYFFEVEPLDSPPNKLIFKGTNDEILKIINCNYINLEGKVHCDFEHSKLYLSIFPNGFKDPDLVIQTNSDGFFSVILPLRRYNALCALADTYATHTLESWLYNFDGKNNTHINFNVTNAEIYNLHAWENNGGGNSLFVAFRPMTLKETSKYDINIANDIFSKIDFQLSLEKDNFKVYIEDEEINIISIQPFYETTAENYALKSYLLQIDYEKKYRNKLLTIEFKQNTIHAISHCYLNFSPF